MVDARGNTVTHGVYPSSGRGAVRPAKVCECTVLSCTGVPVVGAQARREREGSSQVSAKRLRQVPILCSGEWVCVLRDELSV